MTTEPHLWITPSRWSGDPCIGGLNVRAETVAERVWAEGVATVMAEWDLSREVVLMACWWWTLYADLPAYADVDARCRYGEWCAWAHGYLAAMYGMASAPWPKDEIPDPPEVA